MPFRIRQVGLVNGQEVVVNGGFSSSLANWTLIQPPSNVVVPPQPGLFDIANSSPLATGNAFYAHIGYESLVNLQQHVPLLAGVTYSFYADIASTTPMYNLDVGTISVFIDGNGINSYSFGPGIGRVASLSAAYTPLTSGDAVLSINFSRGYLGSDNSPTAWIDNVSLTAAPEPSCLVLGVCGSIIFCLFRRQSPHALSRVNVRSLLPIVPKQ